MADDDENNMCMSWLHSELQQQLREDDVRDCIHRAQPGSSISSNSHGATLPPQSTFSFLPSPPLLLSPTLHSSLPCPSFPSFFPLEVGPLNPAKGPVGALSAVSSPSGVWGGAIADKRFGAYLSQIEQLWEQQFMWIFVRIIVIFRTKTSVMPFVLQWGAAKESTMCHANTVHCWVCCLCFRV